MGFGLQTRVHGDTVEIDIMYIVIMHKSENA